MCRLTMFLTGVLSADAGLEHQSRYPGVAEQLTTAVNRPSLGYNATFTEETRQKNFTNNQELHIQTAQTSEPLARVTEEVGTVVDSLYCCHICGVGFPMPSEVESHLETHSGSVQRKAKQCRFCGKLLAHGGRLRHERIHTGEKPYSCRICHKSFNDPSNMKRHARIVHPNEQIW